MDNDLVQLEVFDTRPENIKVDISYWIQQNDIAAADIVSTQATSRVEKGTSYITVLIWWYKRPTGIRLL